MTYDEWRENLYGLWQHSANDEAVLAWVGVVSEVLGREVRRGNTYEPLQYHWSKLSAEDIDRLTVAFKLLFPQATLGGNP